MAQVIINTSTDATKTLAFNYASQALNNSFFLHGLVGARHLGVHDPALSLSAETTSIGHAKPRGQA